MEKIPVFTINRNVQSLSNYTVGSNGPNFALENLEFDEIFDDRYDRYLHLLSSIKSHFHRSMEQSSLKKIEFTFSKRLKKFQEIVAPFTYWELWSSSEYCSFNEQEIRVINAYRKTGSIPLTSNQLGLSIEKVTSILYKTVHKFKQAKTFSDYKWWLSNQLQQTNRKDLFLNAPLSTLSNKIPVRVLSILSQIGNTLREVLDIATEKELLSMKGMRKKGVEELKYVLTKFDCFDQLKVD